VAVKLFLGLYTYLCQHPNIATPDH